MSRSQPHTRYVERHVEARSLGRFEPARRPRRRWGLYDALLNREDPRHGEALALKNSFYERAAATIPPIDLEARQAVFRAESNDPQTVPLPPMPKMTRSKDAEAPEEIQEKGKRGTGRSVVKTVAVVVVLIGAVGAAVMVGLALDKWLSK